MRIIKRRLEICTNRHLSTRLSQIATLVATAILLAGCSGQSIDKNGKCETTLPSTKLTTPGSNQYKTELGFVALRNGAIKVLDWDSSSRTIVKSGVNYIFGIWSLPVGQVIVYRTDSVEDESKLYYMPIAGTSDPAIITYASAPEYNVTAVSYDRINDRWIITAISDLTETIDIIDRANPSTQCA